MHKFIYHNIRDNIFAYNINDNYIKGINTAIYHLLNKSAEPIELPYFTNTSKKKFALNIIFFVKLIYLSY